VAVTPRFQFGAVHAALLATSDSAMGTVCARFGLVIVCEDVVVTGVLDGRPPLALSTWRTRTGMSELPPIVRRGNRGAWATRVQIDITALREYARAVYTATDTYLARQRHPARSGLDGRVLTALLLTQRQLLCDTRAYAIR
jgi:hypothetical protein